VVLGSACTRTLHKQTRARRGAQAPGSVWIAGLVHICRHSRAGPDQARGFKLRPLRQRQGGLRPPPPPTFVDHLVTFSPALAAMVCAACTPAAVLPNLTGRAARWLICGLQSQPRRCGTCAAAGSTRMTPAYVLPSATGCHGQHVLPGSSRTALRAATRLHLSSLVTDDWPA